MFRNDQQAELTVLRPFIPNLDEPTPASNSNEPYLNYYQYLLAQTNAQLPQVISNSYGDDEQVGLYLYEKSPEIPKLTLACLDCASSIRRSCLQHDRPIRGSRSFRPRIVR